MFDLQLDNLVDLHDSLDRIIAKKESLNSQRPLSANALNRIKEAINIEWTYNSNSIEGNTLTLQETTLVLQEGITVKGKSLREHFETFNHDKAIQKLHQIVNEQKIISVRNILDLHALVLRSIEDEYAGRYRNAGVRITGANFVPPNARKVADLLDELVQFINKNPLQLNDIILAAIFHHRFVWIHPFFDGNGRTIRLVMNLFLMRKGFPPAIILKNDRKKYYAALNQANKGNYKKLTLLIAQAVERSLNIFLSASPETDEEYLPISKIVEESDIPYGQEYVSLLARRGKIDAYKEGRNWVTTKKAVIEYSRHTNS